MASPVGGAPAGNSPAGKLLVVSNRGPAPLRRSADGTVVPGRPRGGLASSLASALKERAEPATWICAAMDTSERDIAAAGDAPDHYDGVELAMVLPDESDYRMAYDVVSNSVLWFAYHDLFDKVRRPASGRRWAEAWDAYRRVNRLFADKAARCAAPGATVLVQDYQLHLVGSFLKEARPDLEVVHFVHTPFCEPSVLGVIPDASAHELMSSMAAYAAVGFHSERWTAAFRACCERCGVATPPTFAAPLGVDAASLAKSAAGSEVATQAARIAQVVGMRKLIVRVDRMEPSKNILRGLLAFDQLLEDSPGLRGKVVFLNLAYPSRESLAEYRTYRAEIETLARRVNSRWAGEAHGGEAHGGVDPTGAGFADSGLADAERSPGAWHPVVLEVEDYYPRSLAAMSLYDVLLVNPVRDGLNLVAKEGPLVNRRDGVVVLSREAGVWDELSAVALGANPFDVAGTSEAIGRALAMTDDERRKSAEALRDASVAATPAQWLDAQIQAATLPGKP